MMVFLTSCWYFGSIHSLERAYVKQDIEALHKNLNHPHQRYMREQSALFLSKISKQKIHNELQIELVNSLRSCVQKKTEFDDVRAACSVTLAHWKITDATKDIIQASKEMSNEELFWMYYALANLKTPEAFSYLEKQSNRDILLQQGLQEWLQKGDPNLEFTPIFQEYMEDVR